MSYKQCTKCHCLKAVEMFDVRRNQCKECRISWNAAYRVANADKERAYSAAYRAANREKIRATKAAYHAANQEKIRAYHPAYYAANLEKIRATQAAYRAATRSGNRVTLKSAQFFQLFSVKNKLKKMHL